MCVCVYRVVEDSISVNLEVNGVLECIIRCHLQWIKFLKGLRLSHFTLLQNGRRITMISICYSLRPEHEVTLLTSDKLAVCNRALCGRLRRQGSAIAAETSFRQLSHFCRTKWLVATASLLYVEWSGRESLTETITYVHTNFLYVYTIEKYTWFIIFNWVLSTHYFG